MNKPNISVVIPVYKAEKYIRTTIQNIVNQTYSEFELLLIDDGSPDASGAICDELSPTDSRIKVYHIKNGGPSNARNMGINHSSADLLCFIDADDIITIDYLENLYKDYINNDTDLVIQGMIKITDKVQTIISLQDNVYPISTDGINRLFDNVDIAKFCGPCCKLFNGKILRYYNIRFSDKIIYSEDYDFLLKFLPHCTKIVTSSATNYNYIIHSGSASTSYHSFEIELSGLIQITNTYTSFTQNYQGKSIISAKMKCINDYTWRVLFSNYKHSYGFWKRTKNLKSIPNENLAFFKSYYQPSSIFTKVVKTLLCNRLFISLNVLLSLRLRIN